MKLVHYSAEPVLDVVSRKQPDTHFKPVGFWVSDDDCEDNWRRWCEAENFELQRLAVPHDVELAADARILRLRDAFGIDAFTRKFTDPNAPVWSHYMIQWCRVAERYDGIIITPYVWSRRLSEHAGWYYCWDCASGCIWNAAAIARVTLRAQAGEARRAETRSGSVHEHAVPSEARDAP